MQWKQGAENIYGKLRLLKKKGEIRRKKGKKRKIGTRFKGKEKNKYGIVGNKNRNRKYILKVTFIEKKGEIR